MRNKTTLDQIFSNIDSNGTLKTSLNALHSLNTYACNIIEKAFKGDYKTIYVNGFRKHIIFSAEDLLLMASEIEDTSIESIVEIAKIPHTMTGFFCFGDALGMLRKLNDAVPLGLIQRLEIYERMVFDDVDKADDNQVENAKRKLYLFSDFLHKEKLFNLLTISQLFRYREFDEIKKRIDAYIPVLNSGAPNTPSEYDLSVEEIVMVVGDVQENVELFNSIHEAAQIDIRFMYEHTADIVKGLCFELKINGILFSEYIAENIKINHE